MEVFLSELGLEIKHLILIFSLIIGGLIATRFIRWLMDKSFVTASDKLNVDATRYKFFKNAVSFVIWIVIIGVIVSLIPKLKSLAVTLFAGAGILVAIAGFAAQQAFSNIVSGVFIVIFKPFRVGDLIKVGQGNGSYGVVEDITLRHTVINNFENKRIIIPNASISAETIINDSISDAKVCRWIEIGISYDSSVPLAEKIIQEVANKHPCCIDVRTEKEKLDGFPQVEVRLIAFNDSSVTLRAYVWAKDPLEAWKMQSDISKEVKTRFEKEGVEIPYPYRTVVYKNDLPKTAKI